ncbi:MAG: GDSL-type esterase/lipase family protein [Actinobacteria bacterium]|nr:GDSL-type esterase/lipase family protein [Actinomycetota bacterium]
MKQTRQTLLRRISKKVLPTLIATSLLAGVVIGSWVFDASAVNTLVCSQLPQAMVTATTTADYQIELTWPSVTDSTAMKIYRDGSWYRDLTRAQSTWADTSLINGVSYSYEVKAVCTNYEVSVGTATAVPTGAPMAPISRDSYSFYIAEGDSIPAGAYASTGAKAFRARPYVRQVTDALVGDGATEHNFSVGGSYCRDYFNGNSDYGVLDRMKKNASAPEWVEADLVTVGVGVHELRDYGGTVSMGDYKDCMKAIADLLSPTSEKQTIRTLAFVTMTPDVSGQSVGLAWATRIAAWNKALKDVAYHSRLPVADAATAFDQAISQAVANGECTLPQSTKEEIAPQCTALFMMDQIHPAWKGHDVIAKSVLDALRPNMPNDFAHQAVPSIPRPNDFSTVSSPSVGSVTYSWGAPAGHESQLRSSNTYEVSYAPAATTEWTTSFTNTQQFVLPVPAYAAAPWWVKVRAYSIDGTPGPWSQFGHDATIGPAQWFTQAPHYHMNDFLRDRSENSVIWDPRNLPNTDKYKNCEGGCAYSFGGKGSLDNDTAFEVYRFNPTTGVTGPTTQITLNGGQRKIWGSPAVFSGSEVFLFGGYQNLSMSNMVLGYDPVTGVTRDTGARLPVEGSLSARGYGSAIWDPRELPGCSGGCAYIFGGLNSTTNPPFYFSQILRYNPTTNAMSIVGTSLPGSTGRFGRCCSSAVWDGQDRVAFLFGGRVLDPSGATNGISVDSIYKFNPLDSSLTKVGSLPNRLEFSNAVWDGTNVTILGGSLNDGQTAYDRILKFDPATNAIALLGQRLPSGRRFGGAICDNKDAYLMGGDWFSEPMGAGPRGPTRL